MGSIGVLGRLWGIPCTFIAASGGSDYLLHESSYEHMENCLDFSHCSNATSAGSFPKTHYSFRDRLLRMSMWPHIQTGFLVWASTPVGLFQSAELGEWWNWPSLPWWARCPSAVPRSNCGYVSFSLHEFNTGFTWSSTWYAFQRIKPRKSATQHYSAVGHRRALVLDYRDLRVMQPLDPLGVVQTLPESFYIKSGRHSV